jgi:hypothetical protein
MTFLTIDRRTGELRLGGTVPARTKAKLAQGWVGVIKCLTGTTVKPYRHLFQAPIRFATRMRSFVPPLVLCFCIADGFRALDSVPSRNRVIHRKSPKQVIRYNSAVVDRVPPQTVLQTASGDIPVDSDQDEASRRKKVYATTFNLVKAIAGSGILALPGGVAAMSDYQSRCV